MGNKLIKSFCFLMFTIQAEPAKASVLKEWNNQITAGTKNIAVNKSFQHNDKIALNVLQQEQKYRQSAKKLHSQNKKLKEKVKDYSDEKIQKMINKNQKVVEKIHNAHTLSTKQTHLVLLQPALHDLEVAVQSKIKVLENEKKRRAIFNISKD